MEEKLLTLYATLCRDAARCELFALRADKEGLSDTARCYRSLALSQQRQAQRFLVQVRGTVGATSSNTEKTLTKTLPAAVANLENLGAEADQLGSRALGVGMQHSRSVQLKNKSLLQQCSNSRHTAFYSVCNFCGFVVADNVPEKCPICTAPARRFDRIS
jgi:rubrerythrin